MVRGGEYLHYLSLQCLKTYLLLKFVVSASNSDNNEKDTGASATAPLRIHP